MGTVYMFRGKEDVYVGWGAWRSLKIQPRER